MNLVCKKNLFVVCIFSLLSTCTLAQQVQQWDRYEVILKNVATSNSFTDVLLKATFSNKDTAYTVDGFYDGDNTFIIRFMPSSIGSWKYVTHSNIKQLDRKNGAFECVAANKANHGVVIVSDTFGFKYADGTQYYPVGTTAYAWNHMGVELQRQTLATLKKASFNKLRMCVFPKDYALVREEPSVYPFNKINVANNSSVNKQQVWDFSTFNPTFFRLLEKQIEELGAMGIEVDLILFHPYDKGRWGFDALPMDVNLRYIKYITSRLGSFHNIWWSIANEWDLVSYKTHDEWLTLSKAVKASDPYNHLLSIHGSTAKYIEYWLPLFSHISVQDEGPLMHGGGAAVLRNIYNKPVIFDEVGYEGNLTSRWGRYSGEEMTYLMWMGAIGGTYVTHGETYMYHNETDTIFWAKGGSFKGTSWLRAGFLRTILEAAPQPLEPSDVSRDLHTASAGAGHYLIYLGKEIHDSWQFNIPHKNAGFKRPAAQEKYKAEIIDTWDMTITLVPEIFTLREPNDYRMFDIEMRKIRLPLKPYLAIRLTRIE